MSQSISSKSSQAQQGATRRYSEKNERHPDIYISGPGQELLQRQINAIEMLLRGLSDTQVAQQAM